MSELKTVTMYTDGACQGNPGPGGYGVVLLYGTYRRELSGGFRLTTNNRMEIMAVIVGLQVLKQRCAVTVCTDSQYVADGMTKGWVQRWRANGWRKNKQEKALNPDLWGQLLDLCGEHEVEFVWLRGHAGQAENERCDALSVEAAQGNDLPDDVGFERRDNSEANTLSLFE